MPQGTGGTTPAQQVTNALNAWSTADTAQGSSGITFAPADASHPATLLLTWDTVDTGSSATTSAASAGALGANNPATITFHPNSTLPDGEQDFQQLAPGYDTAYQQSGLHEIGHLVGLGDYEKGKEPPPGTSVMNSFYGVNDTGVSPPLDKPKGCDVTTATSDSASVSGSGGGSGGGRSGWRPADGRRRAKLHKLRRVGSRNQYGDNLYRLLVMHPFGDEGEGGE